jgi:anti-sigma regulatory factor (Ser/Thr protein kinase)
MTTYEEVTVKLAISGDGTRHVGWLRRLGAAKLRNWGLDALAEDARLVISELVTNAMRYGTGSGIVCRLVIARERLLIEVTDGSAELPQVREVAPSEESGRGMFIVDQLADDWGISVDRTSVWCTLTVPAQGTT